jgi:lysophospholipase L1-like esterase
VAPAFDESGATTYTKDSFVARGGNVYVFKTYHSGVWDNLDVLRIEDVYDDILDVKTSKNLVPITTKNTTVNAVSVTYNCGVLTASGSASANGGRTTPVTDKFTLSAGTYTFSRSASGGVGIILQKSSDNSIISQLLGTTNSSTFTLSADTLCYIGVSTASGVNYSISYNIQVESGSSSTEYESPDKIKVGAVDNDARDFIDDFGVIYEVPALTWTTGKAFIYNSGWVNNTGWRYSDVKLTQGQSLVVRMWYGTNVYQLSVWSDGQPVKICAPLQNGETKTITYTCQSREEVVRINALVTGNVDVRVYTPCELVNKSNIEVSKNDFSCYKVLYDNIIAIGDSLTAGSYTGSDLHPAQSYPAFLKKLLGCEVENAGRGGWSTKDWWDGNAGEQKGFPYYTYTSYDTAVICLGTNGGLTDTLDVDVDPYNDYNDYANTNTGSYCKIIEGMLAQNPDLNIVLCTIFAGGGTPGIDTTNEVIKKIAAKYNLLVVDFGLEFTTAFSIYHAVSNNIHLGRIGYARMADYVRQGLCENVIAHPTNYNYIPT